MSEERKKDRWADEERGKKIDKQQNGKTNERQKKKNKTEKKRNYTTRDPKKKTNNTTKWKRLRTRESVIWWLWPEAAVAIVAASFVSATISGLTASGVQQMPYVQYHIELVCSVLFCSYRMSVFSCSGSGSVLCLGRMLKMSKAKCLSENNEIFNT